MKHILLSTLLVLLFSPSVFSQLTIQDSLVAHYPLNGNAMDVSGNGNHGTIQGAIPNTDRFGNPNSAYFFDGIDDQIVLLANSSNFKPPLPVTISSWVEIEDYQLNNVFQNDFQLNVYHGPWMNIASGRVAGQFGDGGPANSSSRRSKTGLTVLALSTWYHLTTVIRGAEDIDVYINGKQDCGTYSGSGLGLAYSTANGIMGVGTSSSGLYLHGKIDDVRLYSRELSKAEIRELCGVESGPDTICAGDSIQLDAGHGINQLWTGAGLSCYNCPTPIATPTTTTNYQVITENTTGCEDTLNWTIFVDPCIHCDSLGLLSAFVPTVTATTVDISDQSSGTIDSLVWNMGDGSFMTTLPGDSIQHIYPNAGMYLICQTAYGSLPDSSICVDSICQYIIIEETCGTIGLAASFTAVSSNHTVSFQDFSTGPVSSLEWTLGDGTVLQTSGGTVFSYTYSLADTFEACLIANSMLADGRLCSDTTCLPVITTDESACDTTSLTADFTHNLTGLILQATDASFGADINEISWNLDGANWTMGTVGGTVSYTFPFAGVYPVCIEAVDWYNDTLACRDTFCINISVRTVSLDEESTDDLFSIDPNPIQSGCWVRMSQRSSPWQIQLIDIHGRVMFERGRVQEPSLYISSKKWPVGTYFIKIQQGSRIQWRKLIKHL
ncbi:MAG: LamG-like jellyroll fold domain-containing protein [Bacteroidota bacterium]